MLLKLSPSGAGVFVHQYNFNGVDVITSLAIQPNGDVVAAGSAGDGGTDGNNDFSVLRFLPTGALDASFGTGGVVRMSAGGYLDQFEGVVVQPDGKIVAGGTIQDQADYRSPPSSGSIDIVRFNANGSVDTTFGGAGTGQFHYSFAGAYDSAVSGIALGTGGTIVAVGAAGYVNDSGFPQPGAAVLRLTSAGKLDSTFNKTGYVLTPADVATGNDNNLAEWSDVLVQANGDIVADGATYGPGGGATVTRFLPSGALDAAFGSKGSAIENPSGSTAAGAQGEVMQPDGKVVVIGEADVSGGVQRFLFRLTGDTGSISGTVFNDTNANGTQQSTEAGVAGVELYIDLNNNGKIDPNEFTTVTDSLGRYTFLGVTPGSNVIVRQVLAAGKRQTSPANGFGQHVNVAAGVVVLGENFGVTSAV